MKKLLLLSLYTAVLLTSLNAAELKNGTFTFGNGRKGFIQLPEDYTPGKPYKFILFLHGRGGIPGTGANFSAEQFADFRKMCSDKGYIVAVPPLEAKWFNPEAEKITDEMLRISAS